MPRYGTMQNWAFGSSDWKDEPEYLNSVMTFAQTSAPVYWTKLTTYNDYALRVVSGTPSDGGTVNFTTAFSNQTAFSPIVGPWTAPTDIHVITISEMEAHSHPQSQVLGSTAVASSIGPTTFMKTPITPTPYTTGSTGTGGGHSHTGSVNSINITAPSDFRIKYMDVILARY